MINIDGGVARAGPDTRATRDVIELGNGCLCCSSQQGRARRDDLRTRREHALRPHPRGETSVAEPRAIGQLLLQRNAFGRSLSNVVSLSALVSGSTRGSSLKSGANIRAGRAPDRGRA